MTSSSTLETAHSQIDSAAPVEPTDRPRAVGTRTFDDCMSLLGASVSSLCLVWLLYFQILPFSGLLGFVICWYVAFVGLYAGVTALSHPRPVVIDRIWSALVHGGAVVVAIAVASTIIDVFVKGWPALRHMNFYTHDMHGVDPNAALNHGGIWHAIVGTLIMVGIATAIALPLGLAAAVYMSEVGGRFSTLVRTVVEAMTALPDLIAGLFIYATAILVFGLSKGGLAGGLALSVTMLPIIARSSEVVLRVVPSGLREAGFALGAPQWRTVWHVVLPTARPGLGTALILGIARGIGESAPIIIVSGDTAFFNRNPVNHLMNSLPLFTLNAVRSPQANYITRGYGAAAVLLTMVLILFVVIRLLARQQGGSR